MSLARRAAVSFLAAVCLAGMSSDSAAPRTVFHNLHEYFHYLQHSTSPEAKAVLRQIKRGPRDLAWERAEARRAGFPSKASELPQLHLAESENAAPIFQRLGTLLKNKPLHLPRYADSLSGAYAYTPEQLDVVRKALADRPEILDLLRQATDRPYCVFPGEWPQPGVDYLSAENINRVANENSMFRWAARLFSTEGYLLAHDGRYQDAINDEVRSFRVAEYAASSPTLINYLVGASSDEGALAGLKDILRMAGPNAVVDQAMARAFTEKGTILSVQKTVVGEYLYSRRIPLRSGIAEFKDFFRDWLKPVKPNEATGTFSPADQRLADELLAASEAYSLHEHREVAAGVGFPPATRRAFFTALQQRVVTASETNFPDPVTDGTDSMLDLYDMMERRENSLEAGRQVTLATAALMEYRAQNGRFPDQLDERFTDPYTGKPLLYRREGTDGFVVYAAVPEEFSAAFRLPGRPNPIFGASHRPGKPIFFRY
nr:hypothetical protein [Armatimonadota bacterium]